MKTSGSSWTLLDPNQFLLEHTTNRMNQIKQVWRTDQIFYLSKPNQLNCLVSRGLSSTQSWLRKSQVVTRLCPSNLLLGVSWGTERLSAWANCISPTRGQNISDLVFTINPTLVDNVSITPGLSDHDIVLTKVIAKPEITKQVPCTILLQEGRLGPAQTVHEGSPLWTHTVWPYHHQCTKYVG